MTEPKTGLKAVRWCRECGRGLPVGNLTCAGCGTAHQVIEDDDGIVAYIVIRSTDAYRELNELLAVWRQRQPNVIYIDGEQSLYSYRKGERL
jgi:hypothetical protein